MEMPAKKLNREERLVKSILNKRAKYGLKAELTPEEKELVVQQMREK